MLQNTFIIIVFFLYINVCCAITLCLFILKKLGKRLTTFMVLNIYYKHNVLESSVVMSNTKLYWIIFILKLYLEQKHCWVRIFLSQNVIFARRSLSILNLPISTNIYLLFINYYRLLQQNAYIIILILSSLIHSAIVMCCMIL